MTNNSNNNGEGRDTEVIVDDDSPPKQQKERARSAHKGDQAPPNSDDAGRTIAPQMGDPRTDDRRPG
jgi:hypothetical protein